MFDVDFVQRIKVTGLFFLQFYKIVTGTIAIITAINPPKNPVK